MAQSKTWIAGGLVGAALALAMPAAAQDLTWKAPPQDHPVAIINARVHTIAGDPIEDGYVFFDGGVIRQVGPMSDGPVFIATTEIIDAAGMHVYPGLISPVTDLGLIEMRQTRPSTDLSENNDPNGEVYAATAVNPDSWLLPVARSGGVLLAGTWPSGGDIPGHVSLISMDGWTNDDLTVVRGAGLVVNWPNMRPFRSRFVATSDEEQMANTRRALQRIDGYFASADAYRAARAADPTHPIDLRYEGMLACLPADPATDALSAAGSVQEPVMIRADDLDQITGGVTWAVGRGLKPIVVGGRDAPLCAELLRQHDVPVIIGGTLRFPKRADSPYDDAYTLPARLQALGIRWCLASGDESMNERNLGMATGIACAFGLDPDDGLRAITLGAAEIFGVADRYGSLEVGKSATLIVTTGTPLEITSQVAMAFIDGRQSDLSNKQTELDRKYRERYRQMGILQDTP